MKRNIFLLIGLLAIAFSAMADKVSVRTAQIAAQTFMSQRIGTPQQLSLVDFADRGEFPNFYVFGNEHCFVIIAANDLVHPVLGYSTENGFGNETMPECVRNWMRAYDNEVTFVVDNRQEANSEIQLEWERLLNGSGLEPKSRNSVAPLIRSYWNQRPPINDLCPVDDEGPGGHCVAGCGAIAIAQLMNYWEHPIRGNESFSYTQTNHPEYGLQYANFGETVYDWDNMRNVYAPEYSDAEALAVATLVYHVAVSVRMNFTPNASGTSTSRFKNALTTYFDYSNEMELREKSDYSDAQWISMLKNDLDARLPIIYRGCDSINEATNSSEGVAHIFNCDGYDENNLFHFNWGHKGNYDGYYVIGALYPGHEYDHGNRAIFNCHPNTPSINPPTSVNTAVDGQEVTIIWSSVQEAVSYKLYRDDDFVSNVIGNVYIDSGVDYGIHSYTVKSVKADGTMSFRSNSVVADVQFPGPQPTNLQVSLNGHNVNLSWQTENPETAILQYATVYNGIGGGGTDTQGTRTSWAQRFPVSMIQEYAGMAIDKVDFYVRTGKTGDYTVGIYKGDEMNVTELVYQQCYSATVKGWHEIIFPSPVAIDYTQDLWIVFNSYVFKPTSWCDYSGSGHYDALLYSYTQSGVMFWQRLTDEKAWMIRTHITDGTYSYNLYRDGDTIVTNLSSNTYTDSDLPDGIYDYHVTTNYFGGESAPSNTAVADIHFPGPEPTNLQASVNGHDVNLSWQTESPENAILQYGTGNCIGGGGYSNESNNPDFYWAHRYPATTLQQYQGMAVEKVSFYFRTAGEYTMFVYKGTETRPTELLHQQSYSYTATSGSWQDIELMTPILMDCSQDLWIVFLSNVRRPASCCFYDDVTDARLYSFDGVTWRYDFNQNELRSWLIKTYITDGTYTYNLYRNGDAVATDLSGNTYTDTNLPDGIYDYHVTTNYFGGESDPSNTAHVQVGDPSCTLINGYGTSDEGYYLIASPFDDIAADDVTGMTDGDYDLYRFDQSQEREWRNYKADAFTLMAGKGYLYAHKTDVALRITGTQPYDGNGTIALEYVEGHPLTGWNLVGNPYLYDVTSCATEHVAYGCYRMNETKDDLVVSEISEAHPLKPLEACFVRATAENATITFNPHRSVTTGRCESIRIEVAEKGRLADRLMVVRGGANALQKLSLKEKRTKIFATDGQEELSIVPCEGAEQPFCFQAGEEGTYTLTVTLEGMKADYLHLVDAQTGTDVDLLETQSYEFEATPTDEPCRFKLIIKTGQSNECNEN